MFFILLMADKLFSKCHNIVFLVFFFLLSFEGKYTTHIILLENKLFPFITFILWLIYKAVLSGIENGDDMKTLTFIINDRVAEFYSYIKHHIRFLPIFFLLFLVISSFLCSTSKNGKNIKKIRSP